MKNILSIFVVIIIIAFGAYFIFFNSPSTTNTTEDKDTVADTEQSKDNEDIDEVSAMEDKEKSVIGTTVEGHDIVAYHYGTGDKEVLFVGGIHGGYSWNTALIAYEAMDYLKENPNSIPENLKVTVIPVMNPDGLIAVVGTSTESFSISDVSSSEAVRVSGRFNAHSVDLNRNFDCNWSKDATWRNTKVSGGSKAFSEPESQAIKSYVEMKRPTAVVVWYSAAGGVFASSCQDGVLEETLAITNIYAKASGYQAFENFDFYEVTGDMVNWLAKEGIPAISVLLTTHENTEWSKNKEGIKALLKYYAK